MIDPIGAHARVADSIVSYIRTAFGTQFPSLEQERAALLRTPGVLSQEPWIEPLPRYESSGKTIDQLDVSDLPGLSPNAAEDFKSLASCGLFGNFPLHRHQLEMLGKALTGQSCVITAGTGSGKTESFLLPLFAYLAAESARWAAPGTAHAHVSDWWCSDEWRDQCVPLVGSQRRWNRSLRVSQRAHEQRPAAVRALVVYPMNALVEDQLSRMRRALDSPAARTWLTANRAGNRIYVGRYNGLTPVPGHEYRQPTRTGKRSPDSAKIERLAARLVAAERAALKAEEYSAQPGKDDVRYFFPRLDGAEMFSRWDMQDAPPDILITNFSMLSIMLMRDADARIFDLTRQWLAQDDSVFHLIVDELHLYRGTAGTEVAYLLRLLLQRLGLEPGHPKLKVLASSASLEPDDAESLGFLSAFFGQQWDAGQVVPGYPARPKAAPPGTLDPAPFASLASALDTADPARIDAACGTAAAALGATAGSTGRERLIAAVSDRADELAARMINACVVDGAIRAVPLSKFAVGLFEGTPVASAAAAARGLLYARAATEGSSRAEALPSFRLHWFFRNIEGLWACTCANCPGSARADSRTAGKLFLDSRILCDSYEERHRVLELLYCEQCGTTLFGGSRMALADGGGLEMLTADPDIEGVPDRQAARFVERRRFPEFAIFWPSGGKPLHQDAGHWRQPAVVPDRATEGRWVPASLDPLSGRVQLGPPEAGTSRANGYLFALGAGAQDTIPALPAACPACGENYARRRFRKSPIRGFRTGFSKLTQLLSKELFYLLPDDGRKLVLFSDSREEAASLANGVERSHYLDLVREALYDELATLALGEPLLLRDLEASNEPTSPHAARFGAAHPGAADRLRGLLKTAGAQVPQLDDPEMTAVLLERQAAAQRAIDDLRVRETTRTVALRQLFEGSPADPTGPGSLLLRLKALGVNPAGNEVLYQDYKYDGTWHRWTEFFDFTQPAAGWRAGLSPGAHDKRESRLRAKVISEICGVLFSRLYFGFESAGLGYARIDIPRARMVELARSCGASPDVFASICDATVRVMGALYRYRQEPQEYPIDQWPDWASARASLRNFVKQCAVINKMGEIATLERRMGGNLSGGRAFPPHPRAPPAERQARPADRPSMDMHIVPPRTPSHRRSLHEMPCPAPRGASRNVR